MGDGACPKWAAAVGLSLSMAVTMGCSRSGVAIDGGECTDDVECEDGLSCNGAERCLRGYCAAGLATPCDDGDPCTEDMCVEPGTCRHTDLRVDEDRDGHLAASGCGDDCDDGDASVHPGAAEICNGQDDDCDGSVDEGAGYLPQAMASPVSEGPAARSVGSIAYSPENDTWGVAYFEDRDGATMWFVELAPDGALASEPRPWMSGGGDGLGVVLRWANTHYAAVWSSRRTSNYELFFNRFSSSGERLGEDVRITESSGRSVHQSMVFTGAEHVITWQDNRDGRDLPSIYMTFLDGDGFKIGDDQLLFQSEHGAYGPKLAAGPTMLAVAFIVQVGDRGLVHLALTDLAGRQIGGVLRMSDPEHSAASPSIAWHDGAFTVVWQQSSSDTDDIVGTRVLPLDPPSILSRSTVVGGAGFSRSPRLIAVGEHLFFVMSDDRLGKLDLYATRLDDELGTSETLLLTQSPAADVGGHLATGNGDIGVLFTSFRRDQKEPYFTRLLCVDGGAAP